MVELVADLHDEAPDLHVEAVPIRTQTAEAKGRLTSWLHKSTNADGVWRSISWTWPWRSEVKSNESRASIPVPLEVFSPILVPDFMHVVLFVVFQHRSWNMLEGYCRPERRGGRCDGE